MKYNPGLHLLCELSTKEIQLLEQYDLVNIFFDDRIKHYGLHKLGEVYHKFEEGGYTGIVCLTESHIAIHTWPEFNMLTLDIYLSNFKMNNDEKGRAFLQDTLGFFKSETFNKTEVRR